MDKNILYIGGGLAALYFLTKSSSATSTTPKSGSVLSNLLGSGNSTSGIYTDATGHQVSVNPTPAQNAGLTNPNYQMSPTELAAYNANYLDLQQGMKDWIPKYGTLNAALQAHWNQAGCNEHRTFLPLYVKSSVPYVPPPANSGGFLSGAVSTITSLAPLLALAGASDNSELNPADKALLINSTAIALEVLPFFKNDPEYTATMVKINEVLPQIL